MIQLNFLNLFYQSIIGKSARHIIGSTIRKMVGDGKNITILGVGYANPYLRCFLNTSETVIAVTPPYIGAVKWPRLENNRCVCADESHFPLQNNSIDVAILVHALEFAEIPWAMVAELNRVLPVGGRIIAVVPNRGGVWAKKSTLPFGNGRPFTKGQLKKLMASAGFVSVDNEYKLFFPPFSIFASPRISIFSERWGKWLVRENSGVIIGMYEKQALQPIVEKKTIDISFGKRTFQQPVNPNETH